MRRHARSGWFLLVGLALACSAVLPLGQRWEFALVAMIVLGVPHGALDGEIARPLLRPRFGRAWFPVFALPYLALFLVVMLAWRMAPVATLAGFLVASVWHFGSEHTASGDPLGVLLRGAMPIALPVLIHPAATAGVFAAMAGVAMPLMPSWLWGAAAAWLVLDVSWMARALFGRDLHAPAHTEALIRHPGRAARVHDWSSAIRLSRPITALTILIGAALWPLYAGSAPARLLALTIQVLSALTLPHMLLDAWLVRRENDMQAAEAPVPASCPGVPIPVWIVTAQKLPD
jgi:hypothetical protein